MNCTIIGIAGGTASGKTTVAKKVYEESQKFGSVTVIRLDDYYYEHSEMTYEERSKINYDHPESYESSLLVSHLKTLKEGKPINKPLYDFSNHNRSNLKERINPCNVIILEGIMLFAIKELREMCDIKIYVDTPDDIRFIRRLKRDMKSRGRSAESVINQYLETVRPMHHAFVEPSKIYADLIVPEGGHNNVAIDVLVTKIVNILNEATL